MSHNAFMVGVGAHQSQQCNRTQARSFLEAALRAGMDGRVLRVWYGNKEIVWFSVTIMGEIYCALTNADGHFEYKDDQ